MKPLALTIQILSVVVCACMAFAGPEPVAPVTAVQQPAVTGGQTERQLEGFEAYAALISAAGKSQKVTHQGFIYVLAPSLGRTGLPGGWDGSFNRRDITLNNGLKVSVIDPAKPLVIRRGPGSAPQPGVKSPVELPERVRVIVRVLQSLGITVEVQSKSIQGYRCYSMTDQAQFMLKRKPGVSALMTTVALFEPEPGYPNYVPNNGPPGAGNVDLPLNLWPRWKAFARVERGKDPSLLPYGGKKYDLAFAAVHGSSGDLFIQVIAQRLDSVPGEYETNPNVKDIYARVRPRHPLVCAQTCDDTTNWARRVVAALDGIPRNPPAQGAQPAGGVASGATPVTQIANTPPSAPPAKSEKPVAAPAPAATRNAYLNNIAAAFDPKRPNPGRDRFTRWMNQTAAEIARRPRAAAGSALMWGAAGFIVRGLLISSAVSLGGGALLAVCAYGAYQSQREPSPPPEIEAVRVVREKIQKYQKDWKRDFTDEELAELGIISKSLSSMTPAQRLQAYQDADIEFTSRMQALSDMKAAGEPVQ